MRLGVLILSAIIVTVGAGSSHSGDQADQHTTTVAGVKSQPNRQICINISLNEEYTATMLVDTGSGSSFVRRSVLARLGLPRVKAIAPNGQPIELPYNDGAPAEGSRIDRVKVGSLPLLRRVPMIAMDDARMSGIVGPTVDGIIGMNVLVAFALVIDWTESSVTFSYPGKLSESDISRYAFSVNDSIPMVESVARGVFTVPLGTKSGHVNNVDIDTGSTYTRLTQPILQDAGAVFESAEVELRTGFGTMMWRSAVLEEITLGRLVARHFRVTYPPVPDRRLPPAVGVDLLSKARVTILDFPGGKLYLKPQKLDGELTGTK